MADEILTAERLREIVTYDLLTGVFKWNEDPRATKRVNSRRSGKTAGSPHSAGYLTLRICGKNLFAHRLAWLYVHGEHPRGVIDHINGNVKDNRIANLRDTTMAINLQNSREASRNNKSGMLGVHRRKRDGKYMAEINILKTRIRLGPFDTAEAAHNAYVEAKRKHHPGCTI